MKLGNLFRTLFGTGGREHEQEGEAVEYKGFLIRPAPRQEGGRYYVAGVITKSFPEGVKEHRFIRADSFASREEACSFAVIKAQRIIDEQGDRLFSESSP